MTIKSIGRFLTLFFVAFLPWSVLFSVFWSEKLHLDILRFSKELILIGIGWTYIYEVLKKKIKISFDRFDASVLAFIVVLILVTIVQDWSLKSIIYWLRYDVIFLWAIVLFRRTLPLWDITLTDIAKTFLISWGIMLCMSFLVRYVFGEMILTLAGFSDKVSVWDAGWPPPIYHGIAGAAVVRFQGMLEWPNQMAFFLLLYLGTYMTFFAQKKKYFFMNLLIITVLLFLLVQTYSRSAYGGFFVAGVYSVFWSLWTFFRKRKKYKITLWKIITFCLIVLFAWFGFMLQFGNKVAPIFERHGSTSGHFERMYIGLLRFREHPLWHGLAQSGPASRAIFEVNQNPVPDDAIYDVTISHVIEILRSKNPDFVFNTETYYIPESWYIQQMIEGGIIWALLFGSIILMILWSLKKYKYLFAATLAMLLMNLVLHSFESVHTSLIWSIFVASTMMIPQKQNTHL